MSQLARKIGEKLKYPKCCIDYFIENFGKHPKINYSGFVPCLDHQKFSRNEIEKLIGRKLKNPKWLSDRNVTLSLTKQT